MWPSGTGDGDGDLQRPAGNPGVSFYGTAIPVTFNGTGTRSFATDTRGTISLYANDGERRRVAVIPPTCDPGSVIGPVQCDRRDGHGWATIVGLRVLFGSSAGPLPSDILSRRSTGARELSVRR